jgi:hypothetical protein
MQAVPENPDECTDWERAVLNGDAVPAVAVTFLIADMQHWIDLCA